MTSAREHWNRIFSTTAEDRLGWHERDQEQTLKLLQSVPATQSMTAFLAGAGTSRLADALLDLGWHVIASDVSDAALGLLSARLAARGEAVRTLCHDISTPLPPDLPRVDAWIDRAVLHFLQEEAAILGYFENLRSLLRPGGHALFAEFSSSGATKCAGLPVHRYDLAELASRLGSDFNLIEQQEYTFINPNGDPRPYIYALFRRER